MTTWPRGVYFPPVFFFFNTFFPCPCPLSFSPPPSCSPFLLCRPWTQQCLPHALFVTGGIRTITLSTKPCSQQSSIFLWDLDCWGRHCTLILMHVFVFPRRIPTLKNFIFLSHLWGCDPLGIPPLLIWYVSVFVCFCTCCAVDMGWELVKSCKCAYKEASWVELWLDTTDQNLFCFSSIKQSLWLCHCPVFVFYLGLFLTSLRNKIFLMKEKVFAFLPIHSLLWEPLRYYF